MLAVILDGASATFPVSRAAGVRAHTGPRRGGAGSAWPVYVLYMVIAHLVFLVKVGATCDEALDFFRAVV